MCASGRVSECVCVCVCVCVHARVVCACVHAGARTCVCARLGVCLRACTENRLAIADDVHHMGHLMPVHARMRVRACVRPCTLREAVFDGIGQLSTARALSPLHLLHSPPHRRPAHQGTQASAGCMTAALVCPWASHGGLCVPAVQWHTGAHRADGAAAWRGARLAPEYHDSL